MSTTVQIFCVLFILLLASRLLGELALRLGYASLVGELLAGILLGIGVAQHTFVFPLLLEVADSNAFDFLVNLGMFFLMLLAGVELQPREMASAWHHALVIAVAGMVVPLAAGYALGWMFFPESEMKNPQCLFLGVCLAITAVPVSVAALIQMGKLHTRPGRIIVSAAIFDDILGLVLLAVLVAVIRTHSWPDLVDLGGLLIRVVVFFVITIGTGRYVFPRVGAYLRSFASADREFSALVAAALGYGVLAEVLGMHYIIGPFVAGLFFSRGEVDTEIHESVSARVAAISSGFLAPIFFASIGLRLDIGVVYVIPLFTSLLVAAAIITKLVGSGLPALWLGLPRREALAVGIGMSGRGAIELIIAEIAFREGLFGDPESSPEILRYLFSAVIVMAIVTTLFMPIGLKRVLRA